MLDYRADSPVTVGPNPKNRAGYEHRVARVHTDSCKLVGTHLQTHSIRVLAALQHLVLLWFVPPCRGRNLEGPDFLYELMDGHSFTWMQCLLPPVERRWSGAIGWWMT